MAESLERHVKNLESAEKKAVESHVPANRCRRLGQFALTNSDLDALLNQTVMLVRKHWRGILRRVRTIAGRFTAAASRRWLETGVQPADFLPEMRIPDCLCFEIRRPRCHRRSEGRNANFRVAVSGRTRLVSGITVAIPTHDGPMECWHLQHARRKFNSDEVQFLMASATAIGLAVERKRAMPSCKNRRVCPVESGRSDGTERKRTITYFNEAAQTTRRLHAKKSAW